MNTRFMISPKLADAILNDSFGTPTENYASTEVYVGLGIDFDEETCEMKITNGYSYLYEGLDVYAPQTTLDKDGNRILIGWVRMPKKFEGEEWIGMMTLPRVINVIDNKVHSM